MVVRQTTLSEATAQRQAWQAALLAAATNGTVRRTGIDGMEVEYNYKGCLEMLKYWQNMEALLSGRKRTCSPFNLQP